MSGGLLVTSHYVATVISTFRCSLASSSVTMKCPLVQSNTLLLLSRLQYGFGPAFQSCIIVITGTGAPFRNVPVTLALASFGLSGGQKIGREFAWEPQAWRTTASCEMCHDSEDDSWLATA